MKLGLVAFPWNRLLLLDEALSETPAARSAFGRPRCVAPTARWPFPAVRRVAAGCSADAELRRLSQRAAAVPGPHRLARITRRDSAKSARCAALEHGQAPHRRPLTGRESAAVGGESMVQHTERVLARENISQGDCAGWLVYGHRMPSC